MREKTHMASQGLNVRKVEMPLTQPRQPTFWEVCSCQNRVKAEAAISNDLNWQITTGLEAILQETSFLKSAHDVISCHGVNEDFTAFLSASSFVAVICNEILETRQAGRVFWEFY